MKYQKETLWPAFRKSLISNTDYFELAKVWRDHAAKTIYYKEILFPKIAKDLELDCSDVEYLSADAVLSKKNKVFTNDLEIPLVFLKIQNNINAIYNSNIGNDLFTMCGINAPLKIIFTEFKNWGHLNQNIFIEQWKNIAVYNSMSQLTGYLVIIVLGKRENLVDFNYVLFDENGLITHKDDYISKPSRSKSSKS